MDVFCLKICSNGENLKAVHIYLWCNHNESMRGNMLQELGIVCVREKVTLDEENNRVGPGNLRRDYQNILWWRLLSMYCADLKRSQVLIELLLQREGSGGFIVRIYAQL